MDRTDFISKNITEAQVKSIIATAGYDVNDYSYSRRVDNDGYLVEGKEALNLTLLRNAANTLNIHVEIT